MKTDRKYTNQLIDEKTIQHLIGLIPLLHKDFSNGSFVFHLKNDFLFESDFIKEDVLDILNRIGVSYKINDTSITFLADYDFRNILNDLCYEKLIDDYKSYQYYATRENLSKKLIKLADFKTNKEMTLEPSAGQGGIAKHIPSENLHCVEFSNLNAKILKEKGFTVFTDDFINFSNTTNHKYDRVIMSPPFLGGKGVQHVINAYSLLKPNGILVSILPTMMKDKIILKNVKHTYSEILEGDFENTDIDFVILKLEK